MSPLTLRRYRADRLLQRDFEALQGRVVAAVRRRLLGAGVDLDRLDIEACYAQAWHGLYAALLAGEPVENPTGWLILVSHRRALDEHRRQMRVQVGLPDGDYADASARSSPDLAEALDGSARLRQLFEGLRGRLTSREREAAVLCYLQGLSRAEAAERMGVSEARMRKLMEGRGGAPGVAGKVAALVGTIRDGQWCDEQGSLMRAYAFGILDPKGERYRLALMHRAGCPACSAYVTSLRGLAAALPPLALPWALGAGALSGAGAGSAAVAAGAPGGAGIAAGASATQLAAAGSATGAGGSAGAGGWLLAGTPLGAKLALGCALAVGVGAGCVALGVRIATHGRAGRPASTHLAGRAAAPLPWPAGSARAAIPRSSSKSAPRGAGSGASLTSAASREFGPEHVGVRGESRGGAPHASSAGAHVASSGPGASAGTRGSSTATESAAATLAAREFGPG